MTARIVADHERCIGAGQCVRTEPSVFDQNDDDGTVILLTDEPPPQVIDTVRQAIQLCPSGALAITQD